MVKKAGSKCASLKKPAIRRKKTLISNGKKIAKSRAYPNLLEGRPFNIRFI